MRRILEPGQIEAFAQRAIPGIRLPERAAVFAERARRLRELSNDHAIGHSIEGYLRLMAAVVDAQHATLATFQAPLPEPTRIARARAHRMPLVHATSWERGSHWLNALEHICESVVELPDAPANVREVCGGLLRSSAESLETRAEALLAARVAEVDAASAPFLMAALQVCWVSLASRFRVENVTEIDVPDVCPVCGTLPVASVVRVDSQSQGFRYLHCALCATEWHRVRVTCTHCQATKGITYQSIEGGPESVRAECCDNCRAYLKILYQEKDPGVEPLADDLASLALDLLLSGAGYHRVSNNPLLWHS